MKTVSTLIKTIRSRRILAAAFYTWVSLFATPPARAGDSADTPAADEAAEPKNWVNLALGGVVMEGNHGQATQQLRISDNLFGGIEDLHMEQEVAKDSVLKIDGHALAGNEDYLATIELSKADLGYIRAGYSEFRTYYNGDGGFFPYPTADGGLYFSPRKNVQGLDRSRLFFELGLRNPMLPEVTLRYERDTRHGQKDSTIWGDTTLTGLGIRKITPSFRNINEVRDLFTLDIAHALGRTDVGLGVRFEHDNNDNSLNLLFNPSELNQRYVTQHDTLSEDLFTAHGSTVTRFGEKAWFTLGYAFTTFNTDIGGSRVYGPGYDASFNPSKTPFFASGQGFYRLMGGSEWDQHVANMNLMWRPTAHISLIAATRFESQRNDNAASFVDTATLAPVQENSSDDTTKVAESLELRYTGLANWVFYGRAESIQEIGAVIDQITDPLTNLPSFSSDIDRDRHVQKYEIGTNWYACSKAILSAQYYHQADNNRYSNSMIPPGPAILVAPTVGFPGRLTAQDFNSDNLHFRLTLRPLSNVSLVSAYQFQRAEIDTNTFGFDMRESSKTTNHILNESITWSPLNRLYLQANFSYVLSRTETPAAITISNPTTTVNPGMIGPQNMDFKNNYWTLSISAGYALDEKTNIQTEYSYYRAGNYLNNALFTQPYGTGATEHTATVNISRLIRKNVTANLKCGYHQYTDQTSGGHNNFSGLLLFTGIQVRF